VTMHVALPRIPGFLSGSIPLDVVVVGSARSPVDSVAEDS
jgi:hypothetical protein